MLNDNMISHKGLPAFGTLVLNKEEVKGIPQQAQDIQDIAIENIFQTEEVKKELQQRYSQQFKRSV